MSGEPAPRPWTTDEGTIRDANGKFVARTWEDPNAAFGPSRDIVDAHWIVGAVNAYDEFIAMTRKLDEHPEGYDGPCECKLCLSYADCEGLDFDRQVE